MNAKTGAAAGFEYIRVRSVARIVGIVCCLFAIGISNVYGQSIDIRDGSNAVGISGHLDLDPDLTIRSVGGRSAYSIAGVMDVGVSMSNTMEEIDDTLGTVQTLGLLYSIIPVKQQPGLPVSLQLGLSYGISFVDPVLVRAALERDLDRFDEDPNVIDVRRYDGSRSGYTLSALVSGDVPLNERFALRLGAGGEYRVSRTSYTAFLSPGNGTDDDNDIELIGDRLQSTHFGPGIGVVYRAPRGLVVSWNNRLLFDESLDVQYRPEISLAILQQ